MNKEDAVQREVMEETGLLTHKNIYLNWILEYESLGRQCRKYVYISFVKKGNIILNEENIDYKWCSFEEFIKQINWFENKTILKKVLRSAIKGQVLLRKKRQIKFK